ncbi:predicted protein [Uncinocarpus reesii 1704]|uniref:Uncharacterized protein n=1 Tax=Uncinocarpus reesii (strain UAMH 1704) TaxID=336963 RepID=C4JS28_UNCRE|nr:uncharacterized protein UREG_05267 [Uncinocarpus reesii 1704]EEP80425.1 predicted protein [Uncinocarpus reesii 1704]
MNIPSYRSSLSSYPDPQNFSSSIAPMPPPPPSKALLEGYRNVLDSNEDEAPRYNPLNYSHPRSSVLLNASDPVAMHLLAETALTDSMQFEVLSFEEVEELKKELLLLSNRIEASKRKLTLEMKLQEAAFSLSKLYDSKSSRRGSSDTSPESSPKSHRRRISFFGRHSFQNRSDEELSLSVRRCEDIAQELWKLERRASEIRRRILEHTAGVLQMTHKGLKKKGAIRQERNSDMAEFDERSLYRTPEYLDDFNRGHTRRDFPTVIAVERNSVSLVALHDAKRRLDESNSRLRNMILRANPDQDVDYIQENSNGAPADPIIAVQTSLDTLDRGLESMAIHQDNMPQETGGLASEAERRLDKINKRLDTILIAAGSTRPQLTPRTSTFTKSLKEQLDYLDQVVEDADKRVENLTDQKTILTTQIQQQRELNCKSDAERDAHIADLTEEIVILRKDLDRSRKETSALKQELDDARQESFVREQGQFAGESSTILAEKEARQEAEMRLAMKENEIANLENSLHKFTQELEDREQILASKENQIASFEEYRNRVKDDLDAAEREQAAKEDQIASLQSTIQQLRSEKELEMENARQAGGDSRQELQKLQSDYAELESELVRIQTELTMARAELDGAYGSRAERAAQVAANPAIQKEMDELKQRNMSLTEELARC